ncbi:arginine N-succinyltransferase [Laribacter hongkongensis]|uniref:Arginine N-succinyltransferase n=2 Tax=Laribacter hongkongensis TaxID=168471 RepID=A0ABD4SNV2_9NEIS|nr:arginine N-succinyltransferase [Laribacter hongkongensis]MCG9025132.1 arginine N-succinyltransferase [Laribacter hongkongensis]MCG9101470.1 arginine N-succinyltransferase [Laribacter hongkongensis]MCG9104226.1 arginine N-succinyltransferase [Laribacter hongkongensis]MCG9111198.1 arginine N-succinyltransferase [Laribacter hongkongensis]MCG9118225.1 arginine N-succinyltransferase [Laribacter hongkongensis]
MLQVRPVRVSDLPALECFAEQSGVGMTSLPSDRERLFGRIRRSMASFASDAGRQGDEIYVFMLEDEGEALGTAAIVASAGLNEPFYNYRNETLVHASPSLQVNNRIHALNMCHDLTGATQLDGCFVPSPVAATVNFLSRARLLFIACQPERFAPQMVAEFPGWCDEQDQSPFWEAIGRRFFKMSYVEAEHLISTKSKTFVAELMPTYPVYVPLLPGAAQQVMGQIHPQSELPFAALLHEGFEAERYIDIFDGGAVLTADARNVATIAGSRRWPVVISASMPTNPHVWLVANGKSVDFRAVQTPACLWHGQLWITPEVAETLLVSTSDLVCAIREEVAA